MHEPWYSILADAPLADDGGLPHLGQPQAELHAAEHAGIVVPLHRTAVLGAYGEDARSFLHGQLTQAVDDLPDQTWRLAGYCSPKGRLLALMRILNDADGGVMALTHDSVLELTLKRLRMFVLRARVALEDLRERTAVVGLAGAAAAELLAELAGTPPTEPGGVTEAGDLRVLRLPGDDTVPRFVLLAPAAELAGVWEMLGRGLTPAGHDAWELLAVRAGEPEVTDATSEAFVPQMVNLEIINGVSFSKGCYPGQEIVARMHYRGQAKRRMFRILLDTESPPAPGTDVRDESDREAGTVVRSARNRQGRVEALAVLPIDRLAEAWLFVDGVEVGLDTLPYPIPTGE